ncbi:MAG: hypothetical protein Q3M30_07520 [Candidatus Electrothrix sp. Rat3]|nr:hypothetical protein [Candidatus Electrothrix rattekaaiensis]
MIKRGILFYYLLVFSIIFTPNLFASSQPAINFLLLARAKGYEDRGIKVIKNPAVIRKNEWVFNEPGGWMTLPVENNYLIKLSVPGGVVSDNTKITVDLHNDNAVARSGTAANYTVSVTTNGTASLTTPVLITLTYPSATQFPIPYYINERGYLYSLNITDADLENQELVFELYLRSNSTVSFTWIFENIVAESSSAASAQELVSSSNTASTAITTNFKPSRDGFSIQNGEKKPLTKGGECLGMSAYSIWNFLENGTGLYNKYLYTAPACECSDNNCKVQDIIATRAHLSVNQDIPLYERLMGELRDSDMFMIIKDQLINTGKPAVLILGGHPEGSLHAVVAYEINDTEDKIFIYDPNFPGDDNKYIDYSGIIFKTFKYADGNDTGDYYSDVALSSYGNNLNTKERFENISKNAEDGFSSSDASINISSHKSGDSVTEKEITLSGKITSGEAIVKKISVGFNTSSPVSEDGNFSLALSLSPGENKIYFKTEAINNKGDLVEVTNNMQCSEFVLTFLNGCTSDSESFMDGHCWYLGGSGQSCQDVCVSREMEVDVEGTVNYVGSGAYHPSPGISPYGAPGCDLVLEELLEVEAGQINAWDIGFVGEPESVGYGCHVECTSDLGCFFVWTGTPETHSLAADANIMRVCACQAAFTGTQ